MQLRCVCVGGVSATRGSATRMHDRMRRPAMQTASAHMSLGHALCLLTARCAYSLHSLTPCSATTHKIQRSLEEVVQRSLEEVVRCLAGMRSDVTLPGVHVMSRCQVFFLS